MWTQLEKIHGVLEVKVTVTGFTGTGGGFESAQVLQYSWTCHSARRDQLNKLISYERNILPETQNHTPCVCLLTFLISLPPTSDHKTGSVNFIF